MIAQSAPVAQSGLTAENVLATAFPESPSGKAEAGDEFLVIPQNGEPRWILPRNTRLVLPLLRSWSPFSRKAQLQWKCIQTAAAAGLLSLVPRVETVSSRLDFAYWRARLPRFGSDWKPALLVGNPSRTRKAIVFFVDGNSQVQAVGKVPLCEDAGHAILDETAILRHLQAGGAVPVPLFADSGRGIAAQSWLAGTPVPRRLTEQHMDLLASLAEPDAYTSLSAHRDSLAGRVSRLALPLEPDTLRAALSLLADATPLPAFIEHRDFAPWNLRRLPGGALALIDWEWAVRNSLPWQDISRFFFIQDLHFRDFGDVYSVLRNHPLLKGYLQRFGIPAELVPALTLHYLLRNLCDDWSMANTAAVQYGAEQVKKIVHTASSR
jgi:hypothetical protein